MDKNIYLTPQEQILFEKISSYEIIKVDDIANLLAGEAPLDINKICHGLSKKGYLYRLKKGIYLVSDKPAGSPVIKNPNDIALALFSGYIGFSTALRVYNLLDYEPFTIFVVTKNKSREKRVGEYTFKAVAMGDRATGMTYANGVYVSTLAKTFFDCFYRPQYAGGYQVVTQALYEAKGLDWDEFLRYFVAASDALCQRTGYVLAMLDVETHIVPEKVLRYLRGRIKNKTPLLPSGGGNETYDAAWMVMDNAGRENILSWWSHG